MEENDTSEKKGEPISWKSKLAAYLFVLTITAGLKVAQVAGLLNKPEDVLTEVIFYFLVAIVLGVLALIIVSVCSLNSQRITILVVVWFIFLFGFLLQNNYVMEQKEVSRLSLMERIVWQNPDAKGYYVIYFSKNSNSWSPYQEPGEKVKGYAELTKCTESLESAMMKTNQYTTSDWQCVAM